MNDLDCVACGEYAGEGSQRRSHETCVYMFTVCR